MDKDKLHQLFAEIEEFDCFGGDLTALVQECRAALSDEWTFEEIMTREG